MNEAYQFYIKEMAEVGFTTAPYHVLTEKNTVELSRCQLGEWRKGSLMSPAYVGLAQTLLNLIAERGIPTCKVVLDAAEHGIDPSADLRGFGLTLEGKYGRVRIEAVPLIGAERPSLVITFERER